MRLRRTLSIVTLMLIGELIFLLPFVVTRIFRPTFLKVFDITNLELGTAFSLYGIVAMIAYFAGGPIADRFAP
ncbi:MAG: MFS transporter, partial [Ekhidna sp.]|nr:MFS transporter [Ekhidna sp.]